MAEEQKLKGVLFPRLIFGTKTSRICWTVFSSNQIHREIVWIFELKHDSEMVGFYAIENSLALS